MDTLHDAPSQAGQPFCTSELRLLENHACKLSVDVHTKPNISESLVDTDNTKFALVLFSPMGYHYSEMLVFLSP